MQEIKDYIKAEGLDKRTRKREVLWIRFYLFAYLRQNRGLRDSQIGEFFNLDRTTVINGLKQHKNLYRYDKLYKEMIYEVQAIFPLTRNETNLVELELSMYNLLARNDSRIQYINQ